MALPISDTKAAATSTTDAAEQMEAAILRQLLSASGAFKPADVAGGQLRADMFIETLADAVAKGGGIGIARMLEDEIEQAHPGATTGAKTGAHAGKMSHATSGAKGAATIAAEPDLDSPDPASQAASRPDAVTGPSGERPDPLFGATHTHTEGATMLYAHGSQVPVKSGENGTYKGVVHRALNAYQKRAEDTVVGKLLGPHAGDAP